MGFSLEHFFEQMMEILAKDQKCAKTIKQLRKEIEWNYEYAKQCGHIDTK